MNLAFYKQQAAQLIDNINWYERNKDNFKGIDDEMNADLRKTMKAKIAANVTAIASQSFEDAGFPITDSIKHISQVLPLIDAHCQPENAVVVNERGELKSCVELSEDHYQTIEQ
jgi:hypothetical protein